MLRNDTVGHNQTNRENTRDLQNAAVRHHKNNPHSSMEAAFEYIILNSATFRALPAACIEKARRYLALPETDKDQAMKHLHDKVEFPIFIIPVGPTDSNGMTPIKWECHDKPCAWNHNAAINDEFCEMLESMKTQESSDKNKQIADKDTYTELNKALQGLSNNNLPLFLMPFRQVITVKERTPTQWKETTNGTSDWPKITFDSIAKTCAELSAQRDAIDSMGVPSSDELQIKTKICDPQDETPVGVTIYDLTHPEPPRLSADDLAELTDLVSVNKITSETLSEAFGRTRRTTRKFRSMHPIDIHNAWTQLIEIQANKPKPSPTVVHAERVVVGNKKMIKILEFENVLKLQDLPPEYFDEYPFYHIENDGRVCVGSSTTRAVISIDNVYIIEDFGLMIKTMKEAGVRLAKINKTAKLEKEHSDRRGSERINTNTNTQEAIMRFEGNKPLHSEYVEFIGDTGKVRTTHDMSKAIGFRVFDPITREPDQILITFNVAESLRNRRLNDKKDDTQ